MHSIQFCGFQTRLLAEKNSTELAELFEKIDHLLHRYVHLLTVLKFLPLQSIRGQSFNILVVDEANFIKKDSLHAIIGFLAQKTSKILFISSSNTSNRDTSFLSEIKKTPSQILNVICYVCEEHLYSFEERNDAIACPCYRLHKPIFISLDANIKKTANAFLKDSFTDEILGTRIHSECNDIVITETSQNEFDMVRYNTSQSSIQKHLIPILYVYIDPAFTANQNASGTGIAAVGRYKHQYIIYGLEHFYLENLRDDSDKTIAECAGFLIQSIVTLHPVFEVVKFIIEGNSNQAAAVRIACYIKTFLLESNVAVVFYQTTDHSGIEQPFFLLQKNKRMAVQYFIGKFNSGFVRASQDLISHTIKITSDPIEYLLLQLKNIRRVIECESVFYSVKRKKVADDLLIAVILAIYFCGEQEPGNFKPL